MPTKTDANGKALVEFWTWAANKGLMNRNTAGGIRSAVAQVLSVLDDWENTDIETLDVEQTLTRFQNLKKTDYMPVVLETYKRRFRLAVASYLSYQHDPGAWKPGIEERAGKQRHNGGVSERSGRRAAAEASKPTPATGMVEFAFPVREGQIARLLLPHDLKAVEVKRLTAFMNTLVLNADAA